MLLHSCVAQQFIIIYYYFALYYILILIILLILIINQRGGGRRGELLSHTTIQHVVHAQPRRGQVEPGRNSHFSNTQLKRLQAVCRPWRRTTRNF